MKVEGSRVAVAGSACPATFCNSDAAILHPAMTFSPSSSPMTAPGSSAGSGRRRAPRCRACSKRRCASSTGDVAVAGAGRTDAGVHALGQVPAFSLERSIDCRDAGAGAERAAAGRGARGRRGRGRRRVSRALRRAGRRPTAIASGTPTSSARSSARMSGTCRAPQLDVAAMDAAARAARRPPRLRRVSGDRARTCGQRPSATCSRRGIVETNEAERRRSGVARRAPADRLRGSGQRLSASHGPRDCRHAGRHRPRPASGGMDAARCWRRAIARGRPDRAGRGAVSRQRRSTRPPDL